MTFAATPPGEAHFLIFRLSQAYATTALTLMTDVPDQFQIASDSRPAFGASLTLTPPADGAYVHVRYAPAKPGLHTGHLFIESPFASLTIDLSGRSSGLLALRRVGTADPLLAVPRRQSPVVATRFWLGGLAVLAVSALAYLGYSYRNDWLTKKSLPATVAAPKPALHSAVPRAVVQTPQPVRQTPADQPKAAVTKPVSASEPTGEAESAGKTTSKRVAKPARPVPVAQKNRMSSEQALKPTPELHPAPTRPPVSAVDAAPRKTPLPAPADEESELERTLNKKP